MTTIIRTARQTRTRVAATAAGLATAAFMLSACSGGAAGADDASGEYYYDRHGYTEGQLVIDGQNAKYYGFDCSETGTPVIEEEPSAQGEITDSGDQIILASDDEHIGSDSLGGTQSFELSVSGDTKSVSIGGFDFATGEEDAELATFNKRCGGEDAEEPQAAKIPDGTYFTGDESIAYRLTVDGEDAVLVRQNCSEEGPITHEGTIDGDSFKYTSSGNGQTNEGTYDVELDGDKVVIDYSGEELHLHPEDAAAADKSMAPYEKGCDAVNDSL